MAHTYDLREFKEKFEEIRQMGLAKERSIVPVLIDGEIIFAPLFDAGSDDTALQKYVAQNGGVVYTWLGCSGADILLRGRHFVNRVAFTVLPTDAPEEIVISDDDPLQVY